MTSSSLRQGAGANRVLILGGYGAVGAATTELLCQEGFGVLAAGRDRGQAEALARRLPAAETLLLELADLPAYRDALEDVAVVVNCSGREDARLAAEAVTHQVHFVDVTASRSYQEELEGLEVGQVHTQVAGLCLGVQFWPERIRDPGPAGRAMQHQVGQQ
jgi:saccharopine dehydrogenase-like NADP-dependent oxidoreductase